MNTTQHNTTQHNTTQHNTTQHNYNLNKDESHKKLRYIKKQVSVFEACFLTYDSLRHCEVAEPRQDIKHWLSLFCHCERSEAIQNTKLSMCEDLNETDLLTFRLPRSHWSLAMTNE